MSAVLRLEPRRLRRSVSRAALYATMAGAALFALFPLYWMVISSLKTAQELQRLPPTWVPAQPILDAYAAVFDVIPFGRAILNSFVIAGGTTLAIVLTSLMAGYVFAKYAFRGRDLLFYGLLATMFLPPSVMLVPLFRLMQGLGLVDTYLGVMAPHLANAFGIFLMRQLIAGVPDELLPLVEQINALLAAGRRLRRGHRHRRRLRRSLAHRATDAGAAARQSRSRRRRPGKLRSRATARRTGARPPDRKARRRAPARSAKGAACLPEGRPAAPRRRAERRRVLPAATAARARARGR